MQKYPTDTLLLVYDYEFKYGENFYLCITEEAKELILNVSTCTCSNMHCVFTLH